MSTDPGRDAGGIRRGQGAPELGHDAGAERDELEQLVGSEQWHEDESAELLEHPDEQPPERKLAPAAALAHAVDERAGDEAGHFHEGEPICARELDDAYARAEAAALAAPRRSHSVVNRRRPQSAPLTLFDARQEQLFTLAGYRRDVLNRGKTS